MELTFYYQVSMARCVRAMLLLDACQSPCVFPRRIWQQVLHLLRRFHDTKKVNHLCDLPLLIHNALLRFPNRVVFVVASTRLITPSMVNKIIASVSKLTSQSSKNVHCNKINLFRSLTVHHLIMDSALLITNLERPHQHLRSINPHDLPPDQRTCRICRSRCEFPESPILLPCGCIVGSWCLERSFQNSPSCPLCHVIIRIIPGVNALEHRQSLASQYHLRCLEHRSGIDKWPVPSVEKTSGDGGDTDRTEETNLELQSRLGVLNCCHGTFLSMRELEVCISLVDYRLGTTTSAIDVLDAFFADPLINPEWGNRTADLFESTADMRNVLTMLNMRAGTCFLLKELELVVALVNCFHGSSIGLLDVLGLSGDQPGSSSESRLVDGEFVREFGELDIRVGRRNAVEDLGDVFSQANL